eukprot:TRINITY_DN10351_c0_g1_i1.p1 TRINITY_DN10351_c0_g1~~TRINITY_DN10351_c0_g1_i1.p1  ORF type:complete len:161 (+),score=56.13 TRINITY_DN10351_c0_g1_i1:61-483(+)
MCIRDRYMGEAPERYAYINRLQKKLERFSQGDVDAYNLGLGRLLRWFTLVLAYRVADIKIRQERHERLRAERRAIIQSNEDAATAKERALEEARAAVPPEEEFNEEEWLTKYDEEHPEAIKEVPPEVEDDVDADLEREVP